jgi:hypothetical protein
MSAYGLCSDVCDREGCDMGVNVEAWGVNVGVVAVNSGVGRLALERGGEERP